MKAVIYARQSSGDDDFSESVELQMQKCKAMADKEGIDVVGMFFDNNTSGKTYPSGAEAVAEMDFAFNAWFASQTTKKKFRDGLGNALKMLDDADFILCYDITRIYRPVTGSFLEAYIHQAFVAHHIKVMTLNGVIDFSSFNDSLILALQNRVNNEQLRSQTEKCRAALKKLKNDGAYHPGLSRMIGFRPTGRKHEVVLNVREAEMVKDIYKHFNNGMVMTKVTQYVNNRYADVFPRLSARQVIRKILVSPIYAGYMYNSDGELVKAKQVEGKEIVTLDDWMKAKRKLDSIKTAFSREKKHWLPLSAFIYCGQCGDKMIAHGGASGTKPFYTCQRHLLDGKQACKNNITVSNDIREGNGIIEAVKPLLLAEAIKQMKTSKDDSAERKRLSETEVRLTEVKRKTAKLTEMWMSSLMSEDVYESAMKELKMKEAELEKEKTKVEAVLSRDTTMFDWVVLMNKFKGDALTHGEFEQLTNAMLKKILIYRDFIEVKTIHGDATIPRQHVGKYRLCCNYILQMTKGKASIYFYGGKARLIPASSLHQWKKTAQLGDLSIYDEKG